MRAQIRRLLEMAAKPNITLQIVPETAGAHPALEGAFVILDFPEGSGLVYTVTTTDSHWLEKQEEYERYSGIFAHVMALAWSPAESVRHMAALIHQPEV